VTLPDKDIRCPAVGFARSCRDIITAHTCPKFVSIRGKDPQTGADVDRSGCVDSFLPMLLLENAQQSRQTGAAVESFRNEVVKNAEAERAQRDTVLRTLSGRSLALPVPNTNG
jgi:hypothetical protein